MKEKITSHAEVFESFEIGTNFQEQTEYDSTRSFIFKP